MSRYANGIIYKLCCRDTDIQEIYIGSTCAFRKRKGGHKSICHNTSSKGYNLAVYAFIRGNGGWDNWDMIQIEAYAAVSKLDLLSRERHWIETLKPELNREIPGRTDKEYRDSHKVESASYRAYHAVELDVYHKEYRRSHTIEIAARDKAYYQANVVEIAARAKEYQQVNAVEIAANKKIYQQVHAGKIAVYQKIYQQVHSGKIAANKKIYKQSKKNIQTCICGRSYNYGSAWDRNNHYQSQKHQKHLKLIQQKFTAL
jgi:hypothetical protein